jgi:hypothetical protein
VVVNTLTLPSPSRRSPERLTQSGWERENIEGEMGERPSLPLKHYLIFPRISGHKRRVNEVQ